MKIEVGAKTVSELFIDDKLLSVPSFQRNYSWETENTEQFFADVMESAKSGQPHFYGPIVLLDENPSEKHVKVIDGQQRLTSVFIMLSLLRDQAFELNDKSLSAGLGLDTLIRNFMHIPHEYIDPRFSANYLVRDIFQERIVSDPFKIGNDGTRSDFRKPLTIRGAQLDSREKNRTKGLRKNYVLMKSRLEKIVKNISEESDKKLFIRNVFDALTKNFEIHSMVLNSEDDAYLLFETLNDRGLKLSPSDLLKTITLREVRIHSPSKLDTALGVWDQITENLGEYDFSKFLRHYLLTQTKDAVQKPKILSKFRGIIAGQGEAGAWNNLIALQDSSELYRTLLGLSPHESKEVTRIIQRLNAISETHRVLLLTILKNESRFSVKELEKTFRAVEGLVTRWIISKGNAQTLEDKYQELLHAFEEGTGADSAIQLRENILKLWPKDTDVFPVVSNSDSPDIQRYFLRRIEDSTGGVTPEWSIGLTIEHLAPQEPKKSGSNWFEHVASEDEEDSEGRVYADYVYNWGNLVLLEQPLNSAIKNSNWDVKVVGQEDSKYDGLSSSNIGMVRSIVSVDQWSARHILDREQYLENSIGDLISLNWVDSGKVILRHWQNTQSSKG